MRFHRPFSSAALALVFWCAAFAVIVVAGAGPALAGKRTHEDTRLGFKLRLEDSFVQVPPKPTSDEAYIVGEWYEDKAKFDDGSQRPTMKMTWFARPKAATITPSASAPGAPLTPEDLQEAFREEQRTKSQDEMLDRFFEYNEHFFGKYLPAAEHWQTAEKDKTTSGIPFHWYEVNAPTKKKPKAGETIPPGYAFIARLTLDRPGETVEVGFLGSVAIEHAKRFQSEFRQIVKSFDVIKGATDSRNEIAQRDLSDDPEKMIEQIIRTKVIRDWKYIVTKKRQYFVLYHKDVPDPEARKISEQIEDLRAQLYETMFPPDRPVTAVSIVRVCKDRDQYNEYGAPGGSAGYWSSYHKELVFYYNKEDKKDPLRVLYHEAFHQYIHYSVGDFSPHSWFNEGHGDYFAGFNFSAGKFKRDEFDWRVDEARSWKKNPKRPLLADWLTWTQAQYYGRNKNGVPIGANYALGWSFVYFLRTTKKAEYQQILPVYFNTLKASVTRARKAREEWEKKRNEPDEKKPDPSGGEPGDEGKPGGDGKPGDGTSPEGPPPPNGGDTPPPGGGAPGDKPGTGGDDGAEEDDNPFGLPPELKAAGTPDQWLRDALKAALQGVDVAKLEKDWLSAD